MVKTLALTPEINKSLNLNYFESSKKYVSSNVLGCASLLIIDDYKQSLGSVRLIIDDDSAELEFSNDIRTTISNGIDADEIGNLLYTFFGDNKQKVRITLYIVEGASFSQEIQNVKEGLIDTIQDQNNIKIIGKIFDRSKEKSTKKCWCKSWGLCGADEGKKCNGLTGACSGRCQK
jgi:hypothetical protein